MVGSGRIGLAAIALLGSLGFSTQGRAGLLPPAEQNRLHTQLENRPMVFFVAKGPADSCGRGCDRWIAAEGMFRPGTAQRFQAFLAGLSRQDPAQSLTQDSLQNLPVFFHSPGGAVADAMQIGMILRKRRMTASVGRTATERCGVYPTRDEVCQRVVVNSGSDVPARLSPPAGQCHSACVFALVGASARRVPSGAILGVHATRPELRGQNQRALDTISARSFGVADANRGVQAYLSLMGVDPELQEIAARVSSRRLYALSQGEITRFGIETHGSRETTWLPFQGANASMGLVKSLSSRSGSDTGGHTSSVIHVQCSGASGLQLSYLRVLPDSSPHLPTVRWGLAGSSASAGFGSEHAGIAGWSIVAPFDLVERAAEKSTIEIVETYPPSTGRNSQTVNVSTEGLPKALALMRESCSTR